MTAVEAAAKGVDGATQELRIATVMTGGVSLAIWIGGVARELNLLQQASWERSGVDLGAARYVHDETEVRRRDTRALLDLLDLTVEVDVLAGTSAGGINATVLGFARERFADIGGLRDTWLRVGALENLLRDPAQKAPPSLLQGDGVLFTGLCREFDELKGASLRKPPRLDVPETCVFVTTTLLSAETSRFTDAFGTLVQDVDHHGLFKFQGEGLGGAPSEALALAARSSASFPGAFEPAFVPFADDVAKRGKGRAEIPEHPAMQRYANTTRDHWAADGGLLMNRPIQPILQTIFEQPATRQVRRVLLYVVPSPGQNPDPRLAPAPETFGAPLTLAQALLKDLGAVLSQSIAGDLRALRDHNDRVDALFDTRLRMAELATRLGPDRPAEDVTTLDVHVQEQDPTGEVVDAYEHVEVRTAPEGAARDRPRLLADSMLDDYRQRQSVWFVRPVINVLMREVTTMAPDKMPKEWVDELATGNSAERACRDAAAKAVREPWTVSTTEPVVDADALAGFGLPAFEGARTTVLGMLRSAFTLTTSAETREELAVAIDTLHAIFAPGRPSLFEMVHHAVSAATTTPKSLPEVASSVATDYATALGEPHRDASGPAAARATRAAPDLAAAWARLAGLVADNFERLAALVLATRDAGMQVSDVRSSAVETRRRAADELATYLGYLGPDLPAIPVRLFDLHVATRSVLPVSVDVEQPVELVQVSADTRTLLDPARATAESKLTGMQLHHFGAFYKSSWRANDWMWGRIDGAGWVVDLLLDPRRILTVCEQQETTDGQTRAQWFYGRLRSALGLAAPDAEPLSADDRKSVLTEDDVLGELGYLDDLSKELPRSLPLTSLWVAHALQSRIVVSELPVVAREVVSTPSRRPHPWATKVLACSGRESVTIAAAQSAAVAAAEGDWPQQQEALRHSKVVQAGEPAAGPSADALVHLFRQSPVPDEKLGQEIGEPLFTRTVTKAAAVTAAAATSMENPPATVRPLFATIRSVTLVGYRAVLATKGRARALLLLGAALTGIGVFLALQHAAVVGITGLVLALVGVYLIVITALGSVKRALVPLLAITSVLILMAPALPFVRDWLFGDGTTDKSGAVDDGWFGDHVLPWLRGPWWHVMVIVAGLVLLGVIPPIVVAISRKLRKRRAVAAPHA